MQVPAAVRSPSCVNRTSCLYSLHPKRRANKPTTLFWALAHFPASACPGLPGAQGLHAVAAALHLHLRHPGAAAVWRQPRLRARAEHAGLHPQLRHAVAERVHRVPAAHRCAHCSRPLPPLSSAPQTIGSCSQHPPHPALRHPARPKATGTPRTPHLCPGAAPERRQPLSGSGATSRRRTAGRRS